MSLVSIFIPCLTGYAAIGWILSVIALLVMILLFSFGFISPGFLFAKIFLSCLLLWEAISIIQNIFATVQISAVIIAVAIIGIFAYVLFWPRR